MDGNIQTHELDEGLVIAEAKQCGKIVGVVFGRVDGREFALTKNIAVDPSRNIGKLGNPTISSSESEGGVDQ